MRRLFFVFCLVFLLYGCGGEEPSGNDERPFVVTTTNLIRDVVENVGVDDVRVVSLMGPGVDPHVYRATPRDFRRMEQSDIVLYNGLYLEGRLSEILDRLGDQSRAVTGSIPREKLIDATDFGGAYDPHIWFDAELWAYVVDDVRDALTKLLPEHGEDFARRASEYKKELLELHEYAKQRIRDIPEEQRILITAHDAFQYFGRAYGIEVRGLQGLSTATEFGIQDVTRMVSLIIERNIPAIFIETGVSTRAIESVISGVRGRGYEVQLGGSLFSDSMGARGTSEGTYAGMFRHNVETIVQALGEELRPPR
ncbi:MAG: manganese transporter [Balneolaceae bacterium]|nr:MAG: manganese transporter [Balneolaceae bacterium]